MIRDSVTRLGIALGLACVPLAAQDPPPPAPCACSGSIATYSAGSEPACDASRRGIVIVSLGAAGQPDLMKACTRDGAGRFAWTPAGQQNTNTFAGVRMVAGCPLFPDNNFWNSRVDSLPVDPGSGPIISTYANTKLGTVPAFVLNIADNSTTAFPISFQSTEVDGGLYPITGDMQIEGYAFNTQYPVSGGPYNTDAHLLVLQKDQCKLYEVFALGTKAAPFTGGSGAIYDLMANNLRPDGWTSADAAGLAIWPGVLTYAELYGDGEIQHVVRFTVNKTRGSYIWPARHYASRLSDAGVPPMGSRWRLKTNFDENTCREAEHSGEAFPPEAKRLIRGLKHYGMILADNGLAIKISTDSDPRWGDPNSESSANWSINGWAHCISGKDFEVVNSSVMMVDPNSAAVVK